MQNAPVADLVSDSGGLISSIAIGIPGDLLVNPTSNQNKVYKAMCKELSRDMAITFVCESDHYDAVSKLVPQFDLTRPHTVAACLPKGTGTYWVRDPFLCARLNGQRCYLIPEEPNDNLGNHLGQHDQTPRPRIPVSVTGGNCLVGDTFLLVGAHSINETKDHLPQYYHHNWKEAEEAFVKLGGGRSLHVIGHETKTFSDTLDAFADCLRYRVEVATAGMPQTAHCSRWWQHNVQFLKLVRDIVVSGSSASQPLRHIDRFISITGMKRGDKHLLVVGKPKETADPGSQTRKDKEDKILEVLNALSENFAFERNPMPWPMEDGVYAYNNVLVQNNPHKVWLPQFGGAFEAADLANRCVWHELGFDVIPLDGWSTFVGSQGGPHCATKVLERTLMPAVPAPPPRACNEMIAV